MNNKEKYNLVKLAQGDFLQNADGTKKPGTQSHAYAGLLPKGQSPVGRTTHLSRRTFAPAQEGRKSNVAQSMPWEAGSHVGGAAGGAFAGLAGMQRGLNPGDVWQGTPKEDYDPNSRNMYMRSTGVVKRPVNHAVNAEYDEFTQPMSGYNRQTGKPIQAHPPMPAKPAQPNTTPGTYRGLSRADLPQSNKVQYARR